MSKKAWPASLSADERFERAAHIVSRAIDHLQEIIGVTETNRIIIYSPAIARQIPRSYAANAFNLLQWVMLNYEILRLCALWDRGATDRESILAMVDLVDDPAVSAVISMKLCKSENTAAPNEYVRRQLARLAKAIRVARKVSRAGFRGALVAFRDERLAHSLTPPTSPAGATPAPKYGYERRLLRASVAVVDAFNGALRNSSFAFDMSFESSKRNAEAFWFSAKFAVDD